MKQFYKQVLLDRDIFCFYAKCSVCGTRFLGQRLPLLLRRKALLPRLKNGNGGIWQKMYNRSMANSVRELSLQFNRCLNCGQWICDECFDIDTACGPCRQNIPVLTDKE